MELHFALGRRSRTALALLALASAPAVLRADVDDAVEESIQSVTPVSPFIIRSDALQPDPDYDRFGIKVDVDLQFTLGEAKNAEGGYGVGLQLFDADGQEVNLSGDELQTLPFDDGNGVTNLTMALTEGTLVALNEGNDTHNDTVSGRLVFGTALEAYEDYTVRAILLQICDDPDNPGEQILVVVPNQTGTAPLSRDSDPQCFFEFTNLVSGDDEFNVFAKINSVSFDRKFMVESDEENASFTVKTDFAIHRYDGFAGGVGADLIEFSLRCELLDKDGAIIGVSNHPVSIPVGNHTLGDPPGVTTVNRVETIEVTPFENPKTIVDPREEGYRARVLVWHEPADNAPLVAADEQESDASRLLHFTGSLEFGQVETTISVIQNDPTVNVLVDESGALVEIKVAGFVTGAPNYTFPQPDGDPEDDPDTILITALLTTDGIAIVDGLQPNIPMNQPEGPDWDTVAGVRFERKSPGLTLTPQGVSGQVRVQLPAGLGAGKTADSKLLTPFLECEQVIFNQNLQPNADLEFSDSYFLVEESKPVSMEAQAVTWRVQQGRFTWTTASATYVRRLEMDTLENAALPINDGQRSKKSNELYWRDVKVGGNVQTTVRVGSNGDAKLTAEFEFEANFGRFTTHFPRDVEIGYKGGSMSVVDDVVPDDGGSTLILLGSFFVEYDQNCRDPEGELLCPGEPFREGTAQFSAQDDNLVFTRDGGLSSQGTISASSDRELAWGYIHTLDGVPNDESYVHRTSAFSFGSFLMSGSFVAGADLKGLPQVDQEDGPGTILLTGYNSTDNGNNSGMERPGTTAYAEDGFADYAGLNFRASGHTGRSYVAAELFGPYQMTNRCKYYVRRAGVTGIHEALTVPNEFPPEPATIYGYEVGFETFGFNYQSNENIESRTDGSIEVPYPAGFGLEFEEMVLDCLGALKTAQIVGAGEPKVLQYWVADFKAHAMQFAKNEELACDPGTAFLTLGVTGYSAHVEEPLHGEWAFDETGNLITRASGLISDEFGSRLAMPNKVTFDGPGDQTYTVIPVTEAYLNNFIYLEADEPESKGFINFAGTMDVAFFEDLKVHVHTLPIQGSESAPVHIQGGWTDGGDFFSEGVFDLDNKGFPGGSLEDYRNGIDESHRTRAQQSWLGVVNFDIPLDWSSATKSFRGSAPVSKKLMVLTTEYELLYLSARDAELDFGAVFQGIPKISLGSLVNGIDEQTGVLSAITEGASKAVTQALLGSNDGFTKLLGSRVDELMETSISSAEINAVIDGIYADLDQIAFDEPGAYQAALNGVLEKHLMIGQNSLQEALPGLLGGTQAGGILREIDETLAKIQLALQAIVGTVHADEEGNLVLDGEGTPMSGILVKNNSGEYEVVQGLVYALLEAIAPELADNLLAALGGPLELLNDELNLLLEDAKPVLDQIVSTLQELDFRIGQVRDALNGEGILKAELEDLFESAGGQFTDITGNLFDELSDYFGAMKPNGSGIEFPEYDEEEIFLHVQNLIKDELFGTNLLGQVQLVLKQYLYDLEGAIREGIDTVFSHMNRVIRNLLTDALDEVGKELTKFVDDIANVVGGAEVDGYAHITGDKLTKLRIDLKLQLKVPDDMEFHGYVQICELDSEGDEGCDYGGIPATEVRVGAENVTVNWLGSELKFNFGLKMTFQDEGGLKLKGMGGSIEMVEGELDFQSFKITQFGAALNFGKFENYFAATAGAEFDGYELSVGVFFGRTCTVDPLLLVDPEVVDVIGSPPFTGAYVYGEVHMSIINYGCLLRLQAGVGAGAFYFAEGPTFGGKAKVSAGGEAICIVYAKGEFTLIGASVAGQLNLLGSARLTAGVGWCPLCIEFDRTYTVKYVDDKWSFDRK